ncbi:MAG TPA: hypothetical protein DCS43_08245 [Verrucomicrobia bacterium]|nr:hypothetical protein [Verrucomicrobiota bacterium]
MSDTLTQAEIDALRDAVRTGRIEEVAKAQPVEPATEIKVVSYDFRKPQLLSAEHLLALQSLHQAFAKNLQGLLFSMFKISGTTTLAAMDQVSYGEFMLSLESPTYLLGVSMGSDVGPIGMELTPPQGQMLLDMLLGGDGIKIASEPPREFSGLEMDIMRTWIDRVIEELTLAWAGTQSIVFNVFAQGVEPDQVQVAPLDTPCLCVGLKLNINDVESRLHICYPFSTLQSVFQRGDSESEASEGRRTELRQIALRAVQGVPLLADVELGRAKLTAGELESLCIGDVIKLNRRAGDPLPFNIGGREAGIGRIGIRRGQLAMSVLDLPRKGKPAPTAAAPRPVAKP